MSGPILPKNQVSSQLAKSSDSLHVLAKPDSGFNPNNGAVNHRIDSPYRLPDKNIYCRGTNKLMYLGARIYSRLFIVQKEYLFTEN